MPQYARLVYAQSLLSLYENGPSGKSIVGATLPSLRASSPVADSTPRKLDGWPTMRQRPPRSNSLTPLAPVIGAWRLPRGFAADGSPVPGQHESTIHLFAHAPRRMMSCSIIDDPGIVEGGRPNQIVGPNRDHGQLGNARTGPRALGTGAPPAASRRTSGSLGGLGARVSARPAAPVTKLGVVNLVPRHDI